MKICSKCKILKNLIDFGQRKNVSDGRKDACKKCLRLDSKLYYKKNKEKEQIRCKLKYKKNKHKIIKQQKTYVSKRRQSDNLFKISGNLRKRLTSYLKIKKWKKHNKFKNYIGCSLNNLKLHLELQFKKGMTWENYGQWHIDHIKPLSSAISEYEIYKLCHYTNLQPLWAKDNLSKGKK